MALLNLGRIEKYKNTFYPHLVKWANTFRCRYIIQQQKPKEFLFILMDLLYIAASSVEVCVCIIWMLFIYGLF